MQVYHAGLSKGSIGGNCLIYGHFPCSDTENRLSELYDSIVVKAFDEHSLTFQYGEKEYTITPEEAEAKEGGALLALAATDFEAKKDEITQRVDALCKRFPIYG